MYTPRVLEQRQATYSRKLYIHSKSNSSRLLDPGGENEGTSGTIRPELPLMKWVLSGLLSGKFTWAQQIISDML